MKLDLFSELVTEQILPNLTAKKNYLVGEISALEAGIVSSECFG